MIYWLPVALYVVTALYATYLNHFIDRLLSRQRGLIEAAEKLIEQKESWKRACLQLMDDKYPELAEEIRQQDAKWHALEVLNRVGKQ